MHVLYLNTGRGKIVWGWISNSCVVSVLVYNIFIERLWKDKGDETLQRVFFQLFFIPNLTVYDLFLFICLATIMASIMPRSGVVSQNHLCYYISLPAICAGANAQLFCTSV